MKEWGNMTNWVILDNIMIIFNIITYLNDLTLPIVNWVYVSLFILMIDRALRKLAALSQRSGAFEFLLHKSLSGRICSSDKDVS